MLRHFLALLDYVSRAHEIAIRPLSVVRFPSVRDKIFSEPKARIYFKVWLLLPLDHTPGRFLNFWKKKFFLQIFFIFVNMGLYGSENFKTLLLLQMTAERFRLLRLGFLKI